LHQLQDGQATQQLRSNIRGRITLGHSLDSTRTLEFNTLIASVPVAHGPSADPANARACYLSARVPEKTWIGVGRCSSEKSKQQSRRGGTLKQTFVGILLELLTSAKEHWGEYVFNGAEK